MAPQGAASDRPCGIRLIWNGQETMANKVRSGPRILRYDTRG